MIRVVHPGSGSDPDRIPGSKRPRIPHLDAQHYKKSCVALHLLLQALGKKGPGVKKVKTFCCMNSARQRHKGGPRLVLIHAILY